MTTLDRNHAAIINSTTLYQKNVHYVDDYPHKVLKPSTNKKLGRKVLRGNLKGYPMYTLTLVERETCTSDCEHWADCYGNNMPFGHRFKTKGLMPRLNLELDALDKKHPNGYLIRLHVLGDFYSVEYVKFWHKQLINRQALNIYGYSRHHHGKGNTHIWSRKIGQALLHVRNHIGFDRFAIRFSMLPSDNLSANTEHNPAKNAITCLVQVNKSESCGDCTLCWTTKKPITFLDH
jgi:hypothetical protein